MFFPGMNIAPGVDNFTNLLRQGYKDSLDMELAREKLAADQAQNDALMNYRMEMLAQRDKEAFVPVPETAVQTMINPLAAMSAYSAGFEGRPGIDMPRVTPEVLAGTPFRFNESGQIVAPRELVPEVLNTQRSVIGSAATAFGQGARAKAQTEQEKQRIKEANDRESRRAQLAKDLQSGRLSAAKEIERMRLASRERIAKLSASLRAAAQNNAVISSATSRMNTIDKELGDLRRDLGFRTLEPAELAKAEAELVEKAAKQQEIIDREIMRLQGTSAPKAPSAKGPSAPQLNSDQMAAFERRWPSVRQEAMRRRPGKSEAEVKAEAMESYKKRLNQ